MDRDFCLGPYYGQTGLGSRGCQCLVHVCVSRPTIARLCVRVGVLAYVFMPVGNTTCNHQHPLCHPSKAITLSSCINTPLLCNRNDPPK